jgi:hypothetical protein
MQKCRIRSTSKDGGPSHGCCEEGEMASALARPSPLPVAQLARARDGITSIGGSCVCVCVSVCEDSRLCLRKVAITERRAFTLGLCTPIVIRSTRTGSPSDSARDGVRFCVLRLLAVRG